MDWKAIRNDTKTAFEIIGIFVGIVLGIAMIAQGAHRIYLGIDSGNGSAIYYIGFVVLILGGLSVAFLSRKDRIRMTGAYALSLGVARIFNRWYDATLTDDPRIIFVEILFIMLAANTVRIGFQYTRGNVVSRVSLIITASILASTDMLLMIVDQYVEEYLSFLPFDIDSYFYLMNGLMYVALIALLDMEVIRENTELARHAKVLDRIRTAYSVEEGSFIYDDDAKALIERSGPKWKDINDGFVRSEMEFDIITEELRATVVAQIWEGKEPLYMTVVSSGDSIFNADRFAVDELIESYGVLYGYGRDGTRFTVLVKGRDDE